MAALFGIRLINATYWAESVSSLQRTEPSERLLAGLLLFMRANAALRVEDLDQALRCSRAQLQQDVLALMCSGFKRGGFFVEFGAGHPEILSNTWMLEKEFGWTGILAEPTRKFGPLLQQFRSAAVDGRAVWCRSGETLTFAEVDATELSTLSHFLASDDHDRTRAVGLVEYSVESVSLHQLLKDHNAPHHIDFLSIDTEGSELAILSEFDFSQWSISFVSIEHNWRPSRLDVQRLMTDRGYRNVLPELSKQDDWFVPVALLDEGIVGAWP